MIFPPRTRPRHPERRNLVVLTLAKPLQFPGSPQPFFVIQDEDRHLLELAQADSKELLIVPPKPKGRGLEKVGTYARLSQILKMPDGYLRVMVEALSRAQIVKLDAEQLSLRAEVELLTPQEPHDERLLALMQTAFQALGEYRDLQKKIPQEKWGNLLKTPYPDVLIDGVTPYLNLAYEKKLQLYLETRTDVRLEEFVVSLKLEMELNQISEDINRRVKQRLDRGHKEYFLQEKIRELQRELGREDEDPTGAQEFKNRLAQLDMSEEVRQKCLKEAERLQRLQPTSPEAAILRTYLEWVTELPWNVFTPDKLDLKESAKVLDEDHYNMRKAKDRILDFLAVNFLCERQRGPILCFLGPPGTGKTSLARSVARAMGRSFVRISLGGVRDEAEIRGHRKTYVGALPGRIIQGMRRAGTSNPVFLLDEIDKLSSDWKGDPAAALLEVLDPELNSQFSDHYLEVPYDLSRVFFIATANSLHSMSRPLVDRLEVIEVPGYTLLEKIRIAQDFLVPKQKREHGIESWRLGFTDAAVRTIIERYTMESGVRALERNIAQVIRKEIRSRVEQGEVTIPPRPQTGDQQGEAETTLEEALASEAPVPEILIGEGQVIAALGPPTLDPMARLPVGVSGVAIGLAWTESGGRVLPVEVSLFPGKGELVLTGSLGDVMKESARIALSYVKANADALGLKLERLAGQDVHIHFPEGAIPKDGPSAGLAMVSALVSALRERPLRPEIAMTGEVTLTGKVLPVGGLKEKLLAAHRQKLQAVLLPVDNKPQLQDIPAEILADLTIHWVGQIDEALKFLTTEEDHEESPVRPLPAEAAGPLPR